MMPHRAGDSIRSSSVHRLLAADRPRHPVFVEQGTLGEKQVEVAAAGGQVHGLESAAAFLVQDIETLYQPDEIAHFGMAAVAPALVDIHDVGGAADRREYRVAVTDQDILLRVARP